MIDHRQQRVVIQVLVIDHVVLQFVYHLAEVVNLERENAVGMQRFGYGAGGALDIGNMGVDVVGHDQVDLAVFGDDLDAQRPP